MFKMRMALATLTLFSMHAWCKTVEITGTARADGKIVYIEKHRVQYAADGKLLSAETHYDSSEGKPLAFLKSDFTKSLTVPDHVVEDFRTGEVQGLRRENGKIVLFDREKDKSEKTRVIEDEDADKRILIGCQGLNYYVLGNLDSLDPAKPLPLRFLIPGRLDYYDFDMKEVKSDDPKIATFEIHIKNWFLRMFAPRLHAKYERKTKRLVWYEGLSNIKDEHDDNQVVTIDYVYNDKEK